MEKIERSFFFFSQRTKLIWLLSRFCSRRGENCLIKLFLTGAFNARVHVAVSVCTSLTSHPLDG